MPRPALSKISITQLVAELNKRQSKLHDLIAERDSLNVQIAELEALAGAEAPTAAPMPVQNRKVAISTPKRGPRRPLVEYVRDALAGSKGLSIKDIEAEVRKAGYPTKSAKLYNPIFAVLKRGGFRKAAKGVYAVDGRSGKKAGKVKAGKKPAAKAKKRGTFKMSAEQFVLGLVKKPLATGEINTAWKKAGRAGTASVTLSHLFKAKKVERKPLPKGQKGFAYTATPAPF